VESAAAEAESGGNDGGDFVRHVLIPIRRHSGKLAAALALTLGVLAYGYYRYRYPYGWSHCCDKCLMLALHQYAEDHGGAYPAGGATPEASLSLLYPTYADAELLRGKTVPVELVKERLQRGERLTPESCGWLYVEGLTLKDDRRIALLWDKAGLGHFGERDSDGGRTVLLVNLGYEYIAGAEWTKFLAEQESLLAERERNKQQAGQGAAR
jgi:hypothetical protein